MEKLLKETFATLPPPPPAAELVGVAGTVTTLFALHNRIDPYDAERVHGGTLTRVQLEQLVDKLCGLPLADLAASEGLSLDAANSKLARARRAFRDAFLRLEAHQESTALRTKP